MSLKLSEEETAALLAELDRISSDDRYPLSPRIRMLRTVRAKIRPEPVREPLQPAPRQYAPRRATARQRRRKGAPRTAKSSQLDWDCGLMRSSKAMGRDEAHT